jgi:hypothetical protein
MSSDPDGPDNHSIWPCRVHSQQSGKRKQDPTDSGYASANTSPGNRSITFDSSGCCTVLSKATQSLPVVLSDGLSDFEPHTPWYRPSPSAMRIDRYEERRCAEATAMACASSPIFQPSAIHKYPRAEANPAIYSVIHAEGDHDDSSISPILLETWNAPYYNQSMGYAPVKINHLIQLAPKIESLFQETSALLHDVQHNELKMNGKHTKHGDSDPGEIQEKDIIAQTDQRDLSSDSEHESLPQPLPLEYETLSINGSTSEITSSNDQESLSDSTDDACGSPDTLTIMAHAKHQLIATLMREVYTMFDPQWTANVRSHTKNQSGRSSSGSQIECFPSAKAGKRRMQEREDSPPGDGNSREEKRQRIKSQTQEPGLLFACPFNKFDPERYCPNPTSGAKFRSCIGPGFPSIARLKQHLKRIHSAPIQCQRCWITMPHLQAMARHANEEIRCERTDRPQPEGVDQDKMRLITSSWGATWTQIYGILFPGAPIPSPYYEPPSSPPDRGTALPPSPASQEIVDFESYSRRALPTLVEANLQAIVGAEMAPIEESLRTLLVDIVRRCQSTVAQNFQRLHGAKPNSNSSTRSPSLGSVPIQQPLPQPSIVNQALHHYQEPPFQSLEAGVSDWGSRLENHVHVEGSQAPFSDSGYGSAVNHDPCDCPCHLNNNFGDAVSGLQSCEWCTLKHFDFDSFLGNDTLGDYA